MQRLRELGWVEGRTVAIEYRWAEGRSERYAEIAAEFVRLKVNVILTVGGAVVAAQQATSVIPIVFAVATEPVSTGFITSLARPGGNVTGLSMQSTELAGKRPRSRLTPAEPMALRVSVTALKLPVHRFTPGGDSTSVPIRRHRHAEVPSRRSRTPRC